MKITRIDIDGVAYIPTYTDANDDDLCADCDLKDWCTPNFLDAEV